MYKIEINVEKRSGKSAKVGRNKLEIGRKEKQKGKEKKEQAL